MVDGADGGSELAGKGRPAWTGKSRKRRSGECDISHTACDLSGIHLYAALQYNLSLRYGMSVVVDWMKEIQSVALVAPTASVVVSFVVLWFLRRRILHSLESRSSLPAGTHPPETDLQPALDPAFRPPIDWKALSSTASRHRSYLAWLYVWGGIVLALILAAVDAAANYHNPTTSTVPRFLFAAICFGAPLIFVIRVLYGRWRPGILVGRLKPAVIIVLLILVFMSSELTDDPIGVALVSIPLLALLLHHRIRAMGLLSTGFFTVFFAGATLCLLVSIAFVKPDIEAKKLSDPRSTEVFSILQSGDPSRFVSSFEFVNAYMADHLLFALQESAVLLLAGLLASVALGVLLFLLVARSYSRKRLSEQWLVIVSIWFFFALAVAPPNFALGSAINMAAATGFGFVATLLLLRLSRHEGPCVRLLLLRSFSLGERSERLFQEVESLWRSIGSIQLVGATDLALITLEPHELLAWMRGRLRREFVHRQVDVDKHLASFDHQRDPDGRFRVNVIFCSGDAIWKHAVKQLLTHSDCVLLDVRGFTRHRAGCVFEIQTLAESMVGLPVVFLVDQVTDREFIVETWRTADATKALPNGPCYRFVSEQPADGSVAERIITAFADAQLEAEAGRSIVGQVPAHRHWHEMDPSQEPAAS